jgi:hypothetical protein
MLTNVSVIGVFQSFSFYLHIINLAEVVSLFPISYFKFD